MPKFPFVAISSIALWQIFQLPELPEHSSANVTYVMVAAKNIDTRVALTCQQVVSSPHGTGFG